jgi:hypothetical protein
VFAPIRTDIAAAVTLTYLAELCALSDPRTDTDGASLADGGFSRLHNRSNLNRHIVFYQDAEATGSGSGGRSSDMSPLLYDASATNGQAAVGGLELGARVNDGLGVDIDGVVSGQDRGIGNGDGGGEVDGCFRTGRDLWEDRPPFAGRHDARLVW